MAALLYALVILIGIVIGLAIREITLFLRARSTYGWRRCLLRMATAGVMVALLASITIGIFVFHLLNPGGYPRHWIAFWGSIALMTTGLLCLAIADLRQIGDDQLTRDNAVWHDIAETIARHELENRRRR